MPYTHHSDLPEHITKHLPVHAQSIYREAFNHAWEEYEKDPKGRETTAHRVAWAAVKKKYEKSASGQWELKK